MISYDSFMETDEFHDNVRKLQDRIRNLIEFWDDNHKKPALFPVSTWLSRRKQNSEMKKLFISIAVEIDWRVRFTASIRPQNSIFPVPVTSPCLYGLPMAKDHVAHLSKLLRVVPADGSGLSRERIILMLLLEDDGKSWDIPFDILLQLSGVPNSELSKALESLKNNAAEYDMNRKKTS